MYTDPVAYFITWTCYGTWVPGDDRGWNKWHMGDKVPQPQLANWCHEQMTEEPLYLDERQREVVHETIARHSELRGWVLHAVNCRSNHCHVVVTANSHAGEIVRDQFKSWCTRKLKELESLRSGEGRQARLREQWWTRKGSVRYLFEDESLEAAIRYAGDAQDAGGSKVDP